jgi:Lrp/AsnC family transcriptional regulator for asnA, asnC and gidA
VGVINDSLSARAVVQDIDGVPLLGDLSELDRSLLRLLQLDGRRSYAQLSRDTGMTQNAVRRRVREFIDSSLIQITAVLNPHVLGYRAPAILAIRLDAGADRAAIAKAVTVHDPVSYVISTTGRFQVFVEVLCGSTADLFAVAEKIGADLGPGNYVETIPYLAVYYQQADFSTAHGGGAGKVTSIGELEIELSGTDRKIIDLLHEDGRIAFQEIARRLDISEAQVRQRYTRMLDSRALRVLALLNPMRLGFETVVMLGITTSAHMQAPAIAEELTRLPGISYVALCAGRYQILAELVCRDHAELAQVISERISAIEGLENAEPFLYLDLHHWRLRPPA